jgi:hypothetical protein
MSAILHAKYNGAMAPSNGPVRLEQDTRQALGQLVARSVAAQQTAAEADLATIPAQLADLSRRFMALDRRLLAATRRLAQS